MKVGRKQVKVVREGCLKEHKLYGYFQPGQPPKIAVDDTLHGRLMLETFFHELIHAIEDAYKIRLRHYDVDTVAVGLAKALKEHLKF